MPSSEVQEQTSVLNVGEAAPDFELPAIVAGVKERFRLSERRGKQNLLLAFYPSNWEECSARQMRSYQAEREKLVAHDIEVGGICVDSIMNTTVWERHIGPFDFIFCSDFWPHGEVSAKYGVFQRTPPTAGICNRALFVVDKGGQIAFRKVYATDDTPRIEEVVEALQHLRL